MLLRFLLILVASLFVGGACSGDDGESGAISLAGWQAEVRGICEATLDRVEEADSALGNPDTRAELVEIIGVASQTFEDRNDAIAALGNPADRSAEVMEFRELLESQALLLLEAHDAVVAEDQATATRLEDDLAELHTPLSATAADLGVSVCAPAAAEPDPDEPVHAFTAFETIPAGTPFNEAVDAGLVANSEVPRRERPDNALRTLDLGTDVATRQIEAGTVLTEDMFGPPSE